MSDFSGRKILIVGGAGFVGSNLAKYILKQQPRRLTIVDNLLSADCVNVPDDPAVRFIAGTITDDAILANLDNDLDYAFHLACYHGNQSSIRDPLADHDNNALTTLKLFDRLKDIGACKRSSMRRRAAPSQKRRSTRPGDKRGRAGLAISRQSLFDLEAGRGDVRQLLFCRHDLPFVTARFQNVYGPGEILGAGQWRGTAHTVWRNVTPTFVWKALRAEALPVENGGIASRDFIFVEDIVRGLCHCALRGRPGEAYNLASGVEINSRSRRACQRTRAQRTPIVLAPARDWDRSGHRFGDPKSQRELGFTTSVAPRGLAAHHRMDPRKPRYDSAAHVAARGSCSGSAATPDIAVERAKHCGETKPSVDHRRPAAIHQIGAALPRDRPARKPDRNSGSHRPALRSRNVGYFLRGAGHAEAAPFAWASMAVRTAK